MTCGGGRGLIGSARRWVLAAAAALGAACATAPPAAAQQRPAWVDDASLFPPKTPDLWAKRR